MIKENRNILKLIFCLAMYITVIVFFMWFTRIVLIDSYMTEKDFSPKQIQQLSEVMKKQNFSFIKMSPSELFKSSDLTKNDFDCKKMVNDRDYFEEYSVYYDDNRKAQIRFPPGIKKCISNDVLIDRVIQEIESVKK